MYMDWKLERSAQKTESHVLQEQEVTLEGTGEDGISESFQLLQIDVECEHQDGETLPTGNAVWCSLDITEEDCFSLFPLETLVYLTPDSEHALEDVDLNKVYILGGLVDESVQKKVTFQKAQEHSVKTARLPIQEYMVRRQNEKNYHSEILAINQVFDILSTYFDTQNWPEALKKGVSSRKGYVLQNSVE
ncbi:RNA (guanine-9-)-methyltransferase domain-containing protein 3 [Camelus ferus]|nr:RNA (guanine-9-)-methyltransferase domain-containing protein 3 [Camelus ferus]